MRFGVVVCPVCRRAKGVRLSCKTTRCSRCSRVFRLKDLRIMYETDSEQDLQWAIGLVNADIDGKLGEFKVLIRKAKGKL